MVVDSRPMAVSVALIPPSMVTGPRRTPEMEGEERNRNQGRVLSFLTWPLKASLCSTGQASHKPPCPPDPRSKERDRNSSSPWGVVYIRHTAGGSYRMA